MNFLRELSLALAAATTITVYSASAASATLFGISSNILYEIDADTATATSVGALGIGGSSWTGMAYDTNTDTLWATDQVFLYSIDTNTGAGTRIGAHGLGGNTGVHALAFDPNRDTLFAMQALATDILLSIDRTTGAASTHQTVGFGNHQGLAFDPSTDTLFAADRTNRELVSIDPDYVGNHSPRSIIGTFGPNREDILGLTFVSDRNLLFGIQRTSPNGLVSIERDGTNYDRVGNIHVAGGGINLSFQSIAYAPDTLSVSAPGAAALFGLGLAFFGVARRGRAI